MGEYFWFLAFFALYYFIYVKYIAGKNNSDNNMLLVLLYFYGHYMACSIQWTVLQETLIQCIRFVFKCFVGIFFGLILLVFLNYKAFHLN